MSRLAKTGFVLMAVSLSILVITMITALTIYSMMEMKVIQMGGPPAFLWPPLPIALAILAVGGALVIIDAVRQR